MPLARFVALLLAPLPEAGTILQRLAASRDVAEAVRQAARLLAMASPPSVEALLALERTGAEARLAARWLMPERVADWRALDRWERAASALSPDEVVALGVARGPALGSVLHELRRARFERTLTSKAAQRELVRRAVEREG